jgi:acyl carrier protein
MIAGYAGGEQQPKALRLSPPADQQPDRSVAAIAAYLYAEAARVLGMSRDRLDTATPLSSYGLDSLMAMQLRSRVETDLGAALPIIEFLRGASVDELALAIMDATRRNEQPMIVAENEVLWEVGTL